VVERLNSNCLGMGTLPKEVLIKGRWQAGESLPERGKDKKRESSVAGRPWCDKSGKGGHYEL